MSERAHGRVPFRVEVRFRSASSLLVAYSVNLSRGGIFVETERAIEPGTALDLDLDVPDLGKVVLHGRVSWRRAEADVDGPPGLGVEFDDLSDTLGAAIDRLIGSFAGLNVILFCPDAKTRETLRRMLRAGFAAAEVVGAECAAVCTQVMDAAVDLLVVEADDDPAGALAAVAAAAAQTSPVPTIDLTDDDALAATLKAAGATERIGNPPALSDLSRTVLRVLSRPTHIGRL